MPSVPVIGSEVRLASGPLEHATRGETLDEIGEALGIQGRQILHYREAGIRLNIADRHAISLGLHPADVWGQGWWDACHAQSELEQARRDRKQLLNRDRNVRWRARKAVA